MCRRTTCRACGKPSYKGCGQHIEQVLADVAAADRCACPPGEKSGLLAMIFGRGRRQ
jgi:hypothetical protein